jgi:AraC-like DNA-binding protein
MLEMDGGLERLCAWARMRCSQIGHGEPLRGIERMRASFKGHAFTPHRHDTYAVGMTTSGVQSFNYRGAAHQSLPGEVFVLHPDERHDGRAGDHRGFGYCIAYIDPALVREAALVTTLPFCREPVSSDTRLRRAVVDILTQPSQPLDEIWTTCGVAELADALVGAARVAAPPTQQVDCKAVGLVRDMLMDIRDARISIAELETLSRLTRWQLARQFRAAYGVSPYRFHLLRRLDRARELLARGHALADIAQRGGFADQAHLTRQFRNAYGLSPGRWRALYVGHASEYFTPLT